MPRPAPPAGAPAWSREPSSASRPTRSTPTAPVASMFPALDPASAFSTAVPTAGAWERWRGCGRVLQCAKQTGGVDPRLAIGGISRPRRDHVARGVGRDLRSDRAHALARQRERRGRPAAGGRVVARDADLGVLPAAGLIPDGGGVARAVDCYARETHARDRGRQVGGHGVPLLGLGVEALGRDDLTLAGRRHPHRAGAAVAVGVDGERSALCSRALGKAVVGYSYVTRSYLFFRPRRIVLRRLEYSLRASVAV